jgi:hypothetical protein
MPLVDLDQDDTRDLFDETEARHARFTSGRRRKRRSSGMQLVSALPPRKRKPKPGDVERLADGTVRVHLSRASWERLMRNLPETHEDADLASRV